MNTSLGTCMLSVSFVLMLGCVATGCDESDPKTSTTTGDVQAGGMIFNNTCANSLCHGPDGNSGDPNSASLSQAVPSFSDDEIRTIIMNGTGNMAPVFGLKDSDVTNVIAYLRVTFPSP